MKTKNHPCPSIPCFFLRLLLKGQEFYEFYDDLNEIFQYMILTRSKWSANSWFWFRVLESVPGIIFNKTYWRLVMIKNYFKIALRNFRRNRAFSLINLGGYAVGMACCLLILIYIRHESSYDKYHKDGERIYRIVQDIRTKSANRVFAPIAPMVAPTLKSEYPEVKNAARILTTRPHLVRQENKIFYEDKFMYADQELFDVLTIPFAQGNSQGALTRPHTIIISQRMALKYFGETDPIGKTLEINKETYEITGVVVDPPSNTHLKYDLIASLETLADWEEMSNWYSTMFYTYLKLKPNVNMNEFTQQISHLADKHVGEQLHEWGDTYFYFLQPIDSIHLHSDLRYEIEPPGNPQYITIFTYVGMFILLIACLNFMNLSTARSEDRAKEVGLRKVIGAQRTNLIGQFLGESFLMTFLSLSLSLLIAWIAIPYINNLTENFLRFNELLTPPVFFALIGGVILIGLSAGIYPAFILSSIRPNSALKGRSRSSSHGYSLRAGLVIIQFTISVILIFGTLVVGQQFNYMRNQYLGFEKEQKLIIPLGSDVSVSNNYESIKDHFSDFPSISGATVSSSVPGRGVSNFAISLVGEEDSKNQSMFHLFFDHEFIPQYGIEMAAGRPFQMEMSTDIRGAFIINEAAVEALGWNRPEQALGKRLQTGFGGRTNPIIGVTKNFHYRGLQSKIEPLIMEFQPDLFRYLTLSLNTTNIKETFSFIEAQWKTKFPGIPYESFFLDSDFNQQYNTEEQVGKVFGLFTFLGLFIACLGLLGLASFTAKSRTKEIGIRKVLGANTFGIILMLSRQFTKYVLLSNIIAWPVAFYLMVKWLKNYAYRTSINISTFLLSGLMVFLIALLTVSFQSLKAAVTDPIDSIKYE